MSEQDFSEFCASLPSTSLPLTSITAYESLFHRLWISRDGSATGPTILLIGAAGGVGSMATDQLMPMAAMVVQAASRPR